MAIQICPNCKQKGFTWHLDESASSYTFWYCALCKYEAKEDESLDDNCPVCKQIKSRIYLMDNKQAYYYCCKCSTVTKIKTLSQLK